jgi:hypothetical protein
MGTKSFREWLSRLTTLYMSAHQEYLYIVLDSQSRDDCIPLKKGRERRQLLSEVENMSALGVLGDVCGIFSLRNYRNVH